MGKLIDLTGQRFGFLVVVSRGENTKQGKPQWNCLCDCGNECLVAGNSLKSGKITKCRQCAYKMRSQKKYSDMYEQLKTKQFDYLTILGKKEDSGGSGKPVLWKCKCKCGNITYVSTTDLLHSNKDRTCGNNNCIFLKSKISQTKTENLIGQRFGNLIVTEKIDKNNPVNRVTYWKCRCDCGNELILSRTSLIQHHRYACDSCSKGMSTGEKIIEDILKINNISYKKQVTFPDLKGINNGSCKFDFGIYDNNNHLIRLIEYDGEFHYMNVDFLNSKTVKENDIIKNEYCNKNNIKLIRIPYWKKNNITLEKLME